MKKMWQQLGGRRVLYMLCGVLAVLVVALAAGSVYARYARGESGSSAITAKTFYFSSDYLTNESGTGYSLNAGPGGKATVSFTLRNWEDALRISDHDIKYSVTVTESGTVIDAYSGGGTLTATNPVTQAEQAITLSDLEAGKSYVVTVQTEPIGGKGYGETLSATFTVLPLKDNVFMHLNTDDPNVVVLTVWTENITGTAEVKVPAGLVPDGTDPLLNTYDNYSDGVYAAFTVNDTGSFAAPYSSRVYRFFVDTPGFKPEDFIVTVGTKLAIRKLTIGSIG